MLTFSPYFLFPRLFRLNGENPDPYSLNLWIQLRVRISLSVGHKKKIYFEIDPDPTQLIRQGSLNSWVVRIQCAQANLLINNGSFVQFLVRCYQMP